MANCAIYGCFTNRKSDSYKGISLFKVPGGKDEYSVEWSRKLIHIITKDRVVNPSLRKQIESKRLYICEKHYQPTQVIHHPTCSTLVPGSIPMLHLPQKSIITPIPKERTSSISIAKKLSQFTSDPNPSTNVPTKCYKSYTDLCHRVVNLKLPVNWNVTSDESIVSVKKILSEFMIPELEVYITPALDFTVRVFAWNIPETHGIYENNCRSVDNITVSNLVTSLDKFHLCNGVSLFVSGIIPHVVQKTYNTTETFISPIQQKVFYRPANCDVLLTGEQVVCNKCIAFKQRHCRSSMESSTPTPAKLKAPISGTSNARLQARFKLEREEKKLLHDRVKELELALNESSTVEVKDYLHDDLVKIYSQNLNSETPNFMKLFWEEQQKYVGKSRKDIRYHPIGNNKVDNFVDIF